MLIEVETRPQFIPLTTNGLHQIQAKKAYQEGARFTVLRVLLLCSGNPLMMPIENMWESHMHGVRSAFVG
jgi:hypothetical protein